MSHKLVRIVQDIKTIKSETWLDPSAITLVEQEVVDREYLSEPELHKLTGRLVIFIGHLRLVVSKEEWEAFLSRAPDMIEFKW